MQYTEITLNEMKLALAGWEEVIGTSSIHEHVFQKELRQVPQIVVGIPLAGGKLWSYYAGSASLKNTFQANKRIERELGPDKPVAKDRSTQYHPAWTKCESNEYCTEASDLDANKERYRRDTCPHCGSKYSSKNLMEVKRSEENEIQLWKFRCPSCRSILIVFND